MRPNRTLTTAIVAITVSLSISSIAADEQSPEIAQLIEQAGNAEQDEVRLRILQRLQKVPELNADLKSDVDRMVAAVQRWTDYRQLTYFGGEVSRSLDFDFSISENSPLYPLTCLYRGRMLVWITLESGNIIRYEDRRRKFLDKAVENFKIAQAAFPKNRIVRMYLGQPIPWETNLKVSESAPDWAVLQRENLERLTDIIHWWIDNRMQPDGQFGGGWGDDCEMWRWWAPVLIGFDDPKITDAQARFSEALLSQSHMKGGYTSRMTDVEHTAEDSADAITPMMHLQPDSPIWNRRARRLAELMENLWTGRNQRGLLQFKSTYFTVDRVDSRPERACDTVYHVRAVQPTLLLWQRTGDERLGRLFTEWMDTWVDAAARAERGKPAGIVPSAIHWPEGHIGGLGKDWWDPRNHGEPTLYQWPSALSALNDTLLLTYHMTGDEKYLEPLRSMAAIRLTYLNNPPNTPPSPGSEAWCAGQLGLLAGTLAKHKALTGSTEFDALLREDFGDAKALSTDSGRAKTVEALLRSAAALRINLAGYTSEVRWSDRVLRFPALFDQSMMFREAIPGINNKPNPALLYSLVTGDPGAGGYFPLTAVRWLTPPRDIAAIVTESHRQGFVAELYHFGREPRIMSAELYLLAPGHYRWTLEAQQGQVDTDEPRELVSRKVQVEGTRTRIHFRLPPQQAVMMRVGFVPQH